VRLDVRRLDPTHWNPTSAHDNDFAISARAVCDVQTAVSNTALIAGRMLTTFVVSAKHSR
jgi:uncharacterized protein (DUF1778 family)